MFVHRLQEKNEGVTMDGECGSVFEGSGIPPSYSGPQANHKRRRTACREVLESYDQLKDRSKGLEEGKRKILRYSQFVFILTVSFRSFRYWMKIKGWILKYQFTCLCMEELIIQVGCALGFCS